MSQDISNIIRQISLEEDIPQEQVLAAIEEVIDAAYNNPDPVIHAQWEAMPFNGKPTPDEFIAYVSERLRKEQMN